MVVPYVELDKFFLMSYGMSIDHTIENIYGLRIVVIVLRG